MDKDLELIISRTIGSVMEDYDFDQDDDCDAALFTQGYDSMHLTVEPDETFEIQIEHEASILTECIVNLKGEGKYSSDEFDTLPAGTYYFNGKEIRR